MTDHYRADDDVANGERGSEQGERTNETVHANAAPECDRGPDRERPIGDVVENLVDLMLHGPYLTDPAERTDGGDEE